MRQRFVLACVIIIVSLVLCSCDAQEELGINWHGLVVQLITFGILIFLLMYFGYKPILRKLDERSRRIKDSMELAESIKQDKAKTEQTAQEQIAEARKQGQEVITKAEKIGERLKEEARQQARQDAEAIVARAQTEIRAEREEAIAELKGEVVEIAIKAAEKVINRTLDKEAHKQLIEDTLRENDSLKERD